MLSASDAAPAETWRAITPHDTTNLSGGCRGIYVGGTGNVAAVADDGSVVTFMSVPAGVILPIQAKRVNLTNTTASLMVALY